MSDEKQKVSKPDSEKSKIGANLEHVRNDSKIGDSIIKGNSPVIDQTDTNDPPKGE